MAEIILPPEENEETPQQPIIEVDKPNVNSKVIKVEFEALKTKKIYTIDTGEQLYTTDTDAWFEFKEKSLTDATGTYSLVLRNLNDGSIFQRTGDFVEGVAYYKIPEQEIRHAGKWRGQLVYTLENGNTTGRDFHFDVKGHILDGKDVREIVVEDFKTLMSQLEDMRSGAAQDLAALKQDLENTSSTAKQNEIERQEFYDALVSDIDDLQTNYEELLETGVLQTKINEKLEDLETEYAPKLNEVTAQLADKLTKGEVSVSDIDKNKGKFDQTYMTDEFLQQIAGDTSINAVPADWSLTRSKFAENSVTPEALSFSKKPNNLLHFDNALRGYSVDSGTGEPIENPYFLLTDFIPVKPEFTYSVEGVGRTVFYDSAMEFIGSSTSETPTTPVNCFYVKCVVATSSTITTARLNEGNTLLPFDVPEYSIGGKESRILIKPTPNSVERGAIVEGAVEPQNLAFVEQSKNLFNKNNVQNNKRVDFQTGVISTETGHVTHGMIKIKPNATYSKSPVTMIIAYYNRQGTFIIGSNYGSTVTSFVVPENADYAMFSISESHIETFMLNEGESLLPYEPYKFTLKSTPEFPIEFEGSQKSTMDSQVWFSAETIPSFYQGVSVPSYAEGGFSYVNTETTYDDYMTKWHDLSNRHNSFITETNLGKDDSGEYDVYSYSIKNRNYQYRGGYQGHVKNFPKIIIIAGLHGGEKWAPFSLYYLFEDIFDNWQNNKALEYLRFNVEFEIIPVASPSAFMSGYAGSRENINGIDLNRDFVDFSQVESQYIRDLILNNQDASYFIDYHTNGSSGTDWENMFWGAINGDNPNPQHVHNIVRALKTTFAKISRKWIYEDGLQSEVDIIGFANFVDGVNTSTAYARKMGVPSLILENVKEFPSGEDRNSSFTATANKEYIGNALINLLKTFKENPLK